MLIRSYSQQGPCFSRLMGIANKHIDEDGSLNKLEEELKIGPPIKYVVYQVVIPSVS